MITSSAESSGAYPSPAILRLSASVQSLLRSTFQLPTLSSLIVQLAHNALDAQATQVRLFIDVEACSLVCEDDGTGFEASLLVSHEAPDRYTTTKLHSQRQGQPYGVRGEALASMATIGLLRIDTTLRDRTHEPVDRTRWTLLKRGDRMLYSGPSEDIQPPASTGKRPCHGSRVEVRDIYYSLPLRRPFKGTSAEIAKEIDECKRALLDVALREPNVAFRLDGVAKGDNTRILPFLQCSTAANLLTRFTQLRFPILPRQCGTICTQFPIITSTNGRNLDLSVRGFFLFKISPSRNDQHVYLQGHKLPQDGDFADLWANIAGDYRLVNSRTLSTANGSNAEEMSTPQIRWQSRALGSRSVHAAIADAVATGFPAAQEHVDVAGSAGLAEQERVAARLSCNAAFVIDITITSKYTSSSMPCHFILDQDAVTNLVCREIRTCQEGKGLMPRFFHKRQKTVRDRPATTNALVLESEVPSLIRPRTSSMITTLPSVSPSLFKTSAAQARRSNEDKRPAPEGFCIYIDPLSKKRYLLDERTGNVYPPDKAPALSVPQLASFVQPDGRGLRRVAPGRTPTESMPPDTPMWLQETITNWENPVLPRQSQSHDTPIPTLEPQTASRLFARSTGRVSAPQTSRRSTLALPNLQLASTFFHSEFACSSSSGSQVCEGDVFAHTGEHLRDGALSLSAVGLDKSAIAHAHVIAQVDRKYIVCSCPLPAKFPVPSGNDGELLICLDQHAADERVRLEGILADYVAACNLRHRRRSSWDDGMSCGASRKLKEPISIYLPANEASEVLSKTSLIRRSTVFWGLELHPHAEVDDPSVLLDDRPGVRLSVTRLPEPLADRLRVDVNALTGVVRSFVDWCRAGNGVVGGDHVPEDNRCRGGDSAGDWMSALRLLPPRLLDLFKSKACRGAIMFNDPLTLEQCRRIVVDQLASTTFPFRCAHGRTSVTVLCALAGQPTSSGQEQILRCKRRSTVDWSKIHEL